MFYTEAFESNRYYCYFYEDKASSSFDKIVVLSKKEGKRSFNLFLHKNDSLYKTYDEGSRIINVHRDSKPNEYFFFKLTTGSKVFLHHGYGFHQTIKQFEESYGIPFTKKNFDSKNRNPEMNPYLPKKLGIEYKPITFIKWKYQCDSLSYSEYLKKSLSLIFISILSAG